MKSLTVNASTDNLARVLEFIDTKLADAGSDMKTQFQIDLAVEEIYVNIVHSAYTADTGDISIQCDVYSEPPSVEIQFIDQGKPYNPLDNQEPDITLTAEERQIGGLGVLMVKKTMDVVEYHYKNSQNILKIKKFLTQ